MSGHSSYTSSKSTTATIDDKQKAHYIKVAEVIRRYGTPNAQFPSDKDLTFATLREHFDVGGLGTIVKNMKQKKMLDYRDPFVKDDTVLTLIEDYYTEFNPQGITYDEILEKLDTVDRSSHVRSVAAEENSHA